jgi:AcrR family transcriptional regulator
MRVIPSTSPRRRPRQARAQATVEAIVKATAHVLVAEGYDRASTNRIAHAAGVSIGSLYQYFPSKEALVAALVESHVERMCQALTQTLTEETPNDLTSRARVLVRGMMAAYTVDHELHHVLCQEVPKVGELQRVYGFEAHLAEVCRGHLFSNCPCVRLTDVDRAVFLLVNAVPGVIRASLHANPGTMGNEGLVEDLTDMIVRYLA